MFDLKGFVDLLGRWFKDVFSWVSDVYGLLNRWSGPVLSVASILIGVIGAPVNFILVLTGPLMQYLTALVLPASFVTAWNIGAPVVGSYLSFFNSFLPVSETFSFGASLFVLWTAATSYRLVKSYIPTVS